MPLLWLFSFFYNYPYLEPFGGSLSTILIALLFYTPLFNPGRIYYKDNLLFSESDNFHTTGANGTTLQANKKNEVSFQRFSGSKTVYIFEADGNTQLSFSWNMSVEQGQFKVVLIDLKNSKIIETICDGTSEGKKDNYNLVTGEYRIKFVGDNAKLTGQFYIEQK